MDVEIHMKFKSGTFDAHFTSVDVKALMDAGLMSKISEALRNVEATINIKSDTAKTSEPESDADKKS